MYFSIYLSQVKCLGSACDSRLSSELRIRRLIFCRYRLDVPNQEIIRDFSNMDHSRAKDFGGPRPLTRHRGPKSGRTHSCGFVCKGQDNSEKAQGGRGDD